MPEKAEKPKGSLGSAIRLVLLLLALAGVGALVWYTKARIDELNEQLAVSEERAEEINAELRETSADLELALARARSARNRADVAQLEADQTAEQLEEKVKEVESVTAEREQARAEALQRAREAALSRTELEALQARRKEELDRMQEALNRIAPTTRTPAGMVMVLTDESFRFDFDKASLRPENREMLSRIAGILLASEGYRLFIDGHTDDVGTADYNQLLSERRAEAVRNYLVDAGIPEELIETKGYGKQQPKVAARTKEARAANRRVEIGIVDTIVRYEQAVEN